MIELIRQVTILAICPPFSVVVLTKGERGYGSQKTPMIPRCLGQCSAGCSSLNFYNLKLQICFTVTYAAVGPELATKNKFVLLVSIFSRLKTMPRLVCNHCADKRSIRYLALKLLRFCRYVLRVLGNAAQLDQVRNVSGIGSRMVEGKSRTFGG